MTQHTITYIKGPFDGPNRAERRRLMAQARHQGDSPHDLGSLPGREPKYVPKPHEARHHSSDKELPRLFYGALPKISGIRR